VSQQKGNFITVFLREASLSSLVARKDEGKALADYLARLAARRWAARLKADIPDEFLDLHWLALDGPKVAPRETDEAAEEYLDRLSFYAARAAFLRMAQTNALLKNILPHDTERPDSRSAQPPSNEDWADKRQEFLQLLFPFLEELQKQKNPQNRNEEPA